MLKRFRAASGLIPVIAALVLVKGCGEKKSETRSSPEAGDPMDMSAALPAQPFQAVVDLPADTPESLRVKRQEIIGWTPTQADRVDFALKGVTRIIRFSQLGLGDTMEVALPRTPSNGWPLASSLRLNLGREKTAVVTRFKIDTLPGPRAQGEGFLGLMGIHGDTLYGRDIELPRTAASSGRFELMFYFGQLFVQMACCDKPPAVGMARYGNVSDTLTLILTFDPGRAAFSISLIGREAGRTYPGFYWHQFRTERGEYHRELEEFPYFCSGRDSSYVDLFVGSRFRGRRSQLEPVLGVTMF